MRFITLPDEHFNSLNSWDRNSFRTQWQLQLLFQILKYRDVISLVLKSEESTFIGPFSQVNTGAQSTFYLNLANKIDHIKICEKIRKYFDSKMLDQIHFKQS